SAPVSFGVPDQPGAQPRALPTTGSPAVSTRGDPVAARAGRADRLLLGTLRRHRFAEGRRELSLRGRGYAAPGGALRRLGSGGAWLGSPPDSTTRAPAPAVLPGDSGHGLDVAAAEQRPLQPLRPGLALQPGSGRLRLRGIAPEQSVVRVGRCALAAACEPLRPGHDPRRLAERARGEQSVPRRRLAEGGVAGSPGHRVRAVAPCLSRPADVSRHALAQSAAPRRGLRAAPSRPDRRSPDRRWPAGGTPLSG